MRTIRLKTGLTLLAVFGLTACGESSNEPKTELFKPTYVSETCMKPRFLTLAGISLNGLKIKNACIHESSTVDEIVIESAVGKQIEFEVSDNTNHQAVAKYFLYMDGKYPKFRENMIRDIKELYQDISPDLLVNILHFLDQKDEDMLSYIVKKYPDLTKGAYVVNSAVGASFENDPEEIDFSIKAIFHKTGEYNDFRRRFLFTTESRNNAYSEEELALILENMTPRAETYRFIIK